jgi:type I restriction enzyme, S subunit
VSGFGTYSNYRDSGVEWLGRVPRDWPLLRGKFRFRTKKVINRNLQCLDRLALTMNGVIDRSITENEGLQPSDFNSYQIFEKDDLVFKLIDLENFKTSRVGLVPRRGIMSPAYIRLMANHELDPSFFYHQYFDLYLRGIYNEVGGQGVRSAINASDLLDLPVLSPSLPEQTQIAKFLDYETVKIDALIEKQQQLIALLKEKRQAVISHAVTKGLNPDAPMRDSGVEWLGEVPAHWTVPRIGYVARVFNGSTPSRDVPQYWVEEGVPWTSSGKVNEDIVLEPTSWISKRALAECSIELAPKGSVIVGMIGQGKTRATSAMLGIESTINQNMAALVAGPRLDSQYLYRAMTAAYDDLRLLGRGANQPALNCDILRSYKIPVPPLEEQRAITEHTHEMLQRTGRTMELAAQQGELLQERRTALISAAVTGKIDVRGWKAPKSELEEVIA